MRAVAQAKPDWSEADRLRLAATLDVLWGVPSYDRLVSAWGMSAEAAADVLAWAIERLTSKG